MTSKDKIFSRTEEIIFKLRKLYSSCGYSQYKINKFEEYDLYARNRSFLVSDSILTFTDTDGKLMALKPDVTLSIVKNAVENESSVYKLYYDESVYRANGSDGFKEITQTGLESIGCDDIFSQCEVIYLAAESLACISEDYLLDLSHQRLIRGILADAGIPAELISDAMALIGAKNSSELTLLCKEAGLDENKTAKLCALNDIYLPLSKALPRIKEMVKSDESRRAYDELCAISEALELYGVGESVHLDFSIVNDMNYYDGVIFNGFVKDVPESVLSGGRYDRLLRKLGKNTCACGFAVYLDKLSRICGVREYDTDLLLVYGEDTPITAVVSAQRKWRDEGRRVLCCSEKQADGIKYRELIKLSDTTGEV